jgi:hypothetical protein
MFGNWYAPVSVVTATRGACRPVPVTVTVTPGMTAPDESVTLPKIDPMPWACANPANAISSATAMRLRLKPAVMFLSPRERRRLLMVREDGES